MLLPAELKRWTKALQFDMRCKAICRDFDRECEFLQGIYVQRCRIQYGTSAPKTITQFFNVMNTRKCRTLWGRAWASWQNIDEWCNIFNIRCSVQVDTMEPSLTPRRWIYWMWQTSHRVRRSSIKPSLPYLVPLWSLPSRSLFASALQSRSRRNPICLTLCRFIGVELHGEESSVVFSRPIAQNIKL